VLLKENSQSFGSLFVLLKQSFGVCYADGQLITADVACYPLHK
jgi:hypothetical protein